MYGALPDLAFNFGLVDEKQKSFIASQVQTMTTCIQNKEFMKAFEVIFCVLFLYLRIAKFTT